MSIQVTYETDYISLLGDSKMSNACFCYVFYFDLKEKDYIRRIINSKENKYMWNQYYHFDLPKIRIGRVRTTKN